MEQSEGHGFPEDALEIKAIPQRTGPQKGTDDNIKSTIPRTRSLRFLFLLRGTRKTTIERGLTGFGTNACSKQKGIETYNRQRSK